MWRPGRVVTMAIDPRVRYPSTVTRTVCPGMMKWRWMTTTSGDMNIITNPSQDDHDGATGMTTTTTCRVGTNRNANRRRRAVAAVGNVNLTNRGIASITTTPPRQNPHRSTLPPPALLLGIIGFDVKIRGMANIARRRRHLRHNNRRHCRYKPRKSVGRIIIWQ